MSNPRIYIASKNVAGGVAFGEEHLYLIYDPDMDGDNNPKTYDENNPAAATMIVRGGPQSGISSGNVSIQIKPEKNSLDAFGSDTPDDRHLRVLFEGTEATAKWLALDSFARTLGVYDAAKDVYVVPNVEYELTGPNSNSTANSLMNFLGLDLRDWTPYQDDSTTEYKDPALFPGQMDLLDGSGSTTFVIYKYESVINSVTAFYKNDGTDTLMMEKGAELEIRNVEETDGLTRIVLDWAKLNEVAFQTSGGDLTVIDKQNWNPLSDDIIRLAGYDAYKGYQNIEFVFADTILHRWTGGNDTVVQNSSWIGKSITIDGGAGNDVLSASCYAYDMAGGKLMNSDGSETVIKNFETVNVTTNYIYADETSDLTYNHSTRILSGAKGNVSVSSPGYTTIDYSGASQSAIFHLSNIGGGPNFPANKDDVVTIGGKTHTYGLYAQTGSAGWQIGNFIGTDHGDEIHVIAYGNGYTYPAMAFFSGRGNDRVYLDESAPGLAYFYSGGNDVIYSGWALSQIVFARSIAASDVTMNYNSGANILTVNILGHGSIVVNGFYYETQFRFYTTDGTRMWPDGNIIMYGGQPLGNVLKGGASDDNLVASARAQDMFGESGNDTLVGSNFVNNIYGGAGDDNLRGGGGNDRLTGGFGNDTYYYNIGDGLDSVHEVSQDSDDKIVFGAGILRSQISFSSTGNVNIGPWGLGIRIGSDVVIDLWSQYNADAGKVEKLVLADGSVIDLTKGLPFVGTNADEYVMGTAYNDSLMGLQGNDNLGGGAGDDVYIFNLGDSSSHDLYHSICDRIGDISGVDTIEFGVGVSSNDIWFENDGGSIYFHYSSGDVVIIESANVSQQYMMEYIKFSDGSMVDLLASGLPMKGTQGGDNIVGSEFKDKIFLYDGNDTIWAGDGDDIIYGGSGDDIIYGGSGDDVMEGGSGNDIIDGGMGWSTPIIESRV